MGRKSDSNTEKLNELQEESKSIEAKINFLKNKIKLLNESFERDASEATAFRVRKTAAKLYVQQIIDLALQDEIKKLQDKDL